MLVAGSEIDPGELPRPPERIGKTSAMLHSETTQLLTEMLKNSERLLVDLGGQVNMTVDIIDAGALPRPPEIER